MLNNKPFTMSSEEQELDDIFHREKKPLHPDTVYKTFGRPAKPVTKTNAANQNAPVKNISEGKKPVEAQWEPVKAEVNYMDKLRDCAKWVVGFGGLSFLLFYWEQAGLMDESIAVPCIAISTALAGWGVGKHATGGSHR